jgi:hypothetical protein
LLHPKDAEETKIRMGLIKEISGIKVILPLVLLILPEHKDNERLLEI